MRDRNALVHGGNVTGDVFTIRHAEKWDPDTAKTCKKGFIIFLMRKPRRQSMSYRKQCSWS
jgi:hypothetical protein